jgi:hypothetical protein
LGDVWWWCNDAWGGIVFWLLNKYGYKGNDDFTRIKRTSNWFGVVIFSIGGLFVIFVSFAPL